MTIAYPSIITTRSILASYTSAEAVIVANALVTETGFTATYKYDSTSNATANGVTVIIPVNSPTLGRWLIGLSGGGSGGGFATKLISKTANYTVTLSDVVGGFLIVNCDATSGAFTITILPTLGTTTSVPQVIVVKTDATSNAVNISDGSSTVTSLLFPAVGQNYQSNTIYANGTLLRVI